ncbi:MAG TPA: NAD(P)H-hydrate dehydratase [Vicinamibacterales bacterium]|nr:NAD(P)H-hydrate dehydratase [Vicinamibacterales bacterium]
MRVLNADQMREADRRTIEDVGIASLVLMENAGRQVATAIQAAFDDLPARRVAVLAGRGNNGGDGFVVARVLRERGVEASVFVLGALADVRGDARVNLEILGRLGLPVVEVPGEEEWELHASELAAADLIVDAVFGTGLRTPLRGFYETVVADVNGFDAPVVSVDLPSGLSADTNEVIGPVVAADLTVTFAAPKLPLVLPPARAHVGDLVIVDIGIPAQVVETLDGPRVDLLTREEVRALVPGREAAAHKGSFGHVIVAAGSRGKTGAAHLAAAGALRSGAGLVTVATPATCQPVVASLGAEYMTLPLAETAEGGLRAQALRQVLEAPGDVIAAGPGLGTSGEVRSFVLGLLDQAPVPLVLDADALNVLADDPGRLTAREGQVVVVTPHPGEMGRLLGLSTDEVQANRLESARNLATTRGLYVVLKGHRTVIATPSGSVFINPTGNPGMATGGTGDVLTGMLAAWLAQLRDASAACRLAAYLHGAAGDLAADDEGQVAMTAQDLVVHLGDALLELTAEQRGRATP